MRVSSHADHLNTPRLIADSTGATVWRHDNTEPFADSVPDENPSGLGAFQFPLRFPGQYADQETGLRYNDFRDYFPEIGRYVESDPIGLRGGMNTYAYVRGSPLVFADPSGLDVKVCHFPGVPTHIGFGVGSLSSDIQTSGFYPQKHRTPVGKGTINKDDLSEPGTQCKGIVTTPKQDDCLTRCKQRYEDDPGRYHFLRRNCSDYVYTCLRERGLPPGADSFWPKTLYDSVSGTPIPATGIPIFYP